MFTTSISYLYIALELKRYVQEFPEHFHPATSHTHFCLALVKLLYYVLTIHLKLLKGSETDSLIFQIYLYLWYYLISIDIAVLLLTIRWHILVIKIIFSGYSVISFLGLETSLLFDSHLLQIYSLSLDGYLIFEHPVPQNWNSSLVQQTSGGW